MVRRPEKLAIKYSFRAAQHSGAFVQLPLRPADAFGKAAKERGVDLSFGQSLREKLEELDEVGALCPVLFERAGEPVLREEHEFVPWAEYRVSEDYDTRTKPRYCHWQLLYVKDAVSLGTAEVSLDWLLDDDRRATLGEGYRSWSSKREEQRRSLHDQWRTLVLLLVRLQSRYAPLIKGTLTKSTSTLVFDPEVGDHVDPFHDTVRSYDPRGVLEELGLTVKNIEDFQRWLGVHGHVNDPVEHWHMLLRMTSYREREKLRDGARRAHDAYDAAEILRRFYHDRTGELASSRQAASRRRSGGLHGHLPGQVRKHDLRDGPEHRRRSVGLTGDGR